MGPEGRGDEIGSALTRLRRAGSALLVVGAVPDRLHGHTCEELSGERSDERLFVRTGAGGEAAVAASSTDRVLELDAASRGTAAASEPGGTSGADTLASGSGGGATTVPTLSAGGSAFENALAALDTAAEGPQVCVESVLPLIETAGEEQAFRFLHLVTARVRQRGGSCHLHLSLPHDSETARTLAALVDATVELRLVDDQPAQRWHIHDEGVQSDWLPLADE